MRNKTDSNRDIINNKSQKLQSNDEDDNISFKVLSFKYSVMKEVN